MFVQNFAPTYQVDFEIFDRISGHFELVSAGGKS